MAGGVDAIEVGVRDDRRHRGALTPVTGCPGRRPGRRPWARSGQAPTHGFMEYDAVIADRLEPTIGETCQAAGKRPHIIMVHDESSFDITAALGIRIPPDYRRHFVSFDGRIRSFAVEGVGGPSWYASTGHTSTQSISLQRIQLLLTM